MHEAYRHISTRLDSPICCDIKTDICIVAPQVAPDLPGYESPVTGKWIEGRAARREDLKRTGCRPYEDGERQEHHRQVKYEENRQDNTRKEAVARAFYAMPESKRKLLTRG